MICHNLCTFGKPLGKKSALLGQKQCFLGKKCPITRYMLQIILSWSFKFAIKRKNDAFVAKIANMRLTEIFVGIFALAERLPTAATLKYGNPSVQGTNRVSQKKAAHRMLMEPSIPNQNWVLCDQNIRLTWLESVWFHLVLKGNDQKKYHRRWR